MPKKKKSKTRVAKKTTRVKTSKTKKKTPSKSKKSSVTKKHRSAAKKTTRASKPLSLSAPKALRSSEVFKACKATTFKFKDTNHFDASHDIISQSRAVSAINMGLGIRKPGYNIYVAGIQGTGKTSVMRTFLEKWSKNSERPADFVYVYNFADGESPRAITLKAGDAKPFKKAMDALVKNLRESIPNALQSEDYENAVNAYLGTINEKKSKLYSELEKLARTMGFVIKSTRLGIETIPVVEGRTLSEKEYGKLGDEDRSKIEEFRAQLEPAVLDFARKVRAIEGEANDYVEKLRSEIGENVVGAEIDPISERYKHDLEVVEYLKEVKEHILENLLDFVDDDEGGDSPEPYMVGPEERDPFRKYRVNVFIDNTKTSGAPVIIESNPTYYNLFGRIEKNVEHGMYLTDFTMVKAGAVHRANGGYLVLQAMDIFKTPSIWDTLKRVLKNRLGFIEDMGEQYSLLPTSGLRPEPIPLDIKVILIGNDDIYHMLYEMDEDFNKIFKVKADFDYKMPRDAGTVNSYASFIATRTIKEKLLPFNRDGIAAVVEHGSRLVEDQRFLSTQFGELKDLTIESDYVAREVGSKIVGREHVEAALDQKFHRLNLTEEHLLEMVKFEDILLSVDGARTGQVNGLAVYDMGDYSFGKIGRITCTTSIGDDGIFNIERASKLSGRIHDKGVYVLTGFLNATLARERSLGFSASVCFEQNYGIIDGDSATVAELVAIISAMAEIPVFQNCAMTGSLNQFGDVQPVGGVNEKIEGFYKTCRLIGKGEKFFLMLPHQNVPNLMLHKELREAIDDGYLEIYPIKNIAEAFELATGRRLGVKNIHENKIEPDSALGEIAAKLERLHDEKDSDHENSDHASSEHQKNRKAASSRMKSKRRMP
jgi:predicted ATP-dependent protease